jgi:5-methylcytosine-specific restriction endonuclease McrA
MPEKRVTAQLRKQVSERANGCCEYCLSQEQFTPETFCIEHIIPRTKGGKTTLENLALACVGCNSHKYTRIQAIDPTTENVVPLFHPRKHVWHQHFTWSDDLTEIVGATPTGRATIVALHLNRRNVVNLRRLLLLIQKHPPKP